MGRTVGLLIAGAALLTGAVQQMENDAVETVRHDVLLGVRQRAFHGRQLARNAGALLRLLIAIALLLHGLKVARSESAGGDEVEPFTPLPR